MLAGELGGHQTLPGQLAGEGAWPSRATSLLCRLGTSPCLCPQRGFLAPNSMCLLGTLALWAVLQWFHLRDITGTPLQGAAPLHCLTFMRLQSKDVAAAPQARQRREAQGHRHSLPALSLLVVTVWFQSWPRLSSVLSPEQFLSSHHLSWKRVHTRANQGITRVGK